MAIDCMFSPVVAKWFLDAGGVDTSQPVGMALAEQIVLAARKRFPDLDLERYIIGWCKHYGMNVPVDVVKKWNNQEMKGAEPRLCKKDKPQSDEPMFPEFL